MTVSVCMITFNHEKCIGQAIENILNQKTNFELELIISNDCSTDNTNSVINNIIKEHPKGNSIKYFNHTKNLGMLPNFLFALKQCEGKYVALCDGDDYWTNDEKLQKQVDFLESNTDYSICFHKVGILQNHEIIEDAITRKVPETTTIMDLAKGNYIHTVSVVYRNNLFKKFPRYFKKSPVGDYFLHLLCARYGKIKYLDESMAIYRLHSESNWSKLDQIKRDQIWTAFLIKIKPLFDKEIQQILKNQIESMPGYISTKDQIRKRIKSFFRK